MTVKHDGIIVHCAATQPKWMEDNSAVDQMKEIDKTFSSKEVCYIKTNVMHAENGRPYLLVLAVEI